MQLEFEIDKLTMEFTDNNFRERMIALDEIGFIGNQDYQYSKKDEYLFSTLFQTLRKFRKESKREITAEEILQLGKKLEYNYNNTCT